MAEKAMTLRLPRYQALCVEAMARAEDKSKLSVVREAIDAYLATRTDSKETA